MTKLQANLSIDPHTWEKAKSAYESASQRVEELIEADLDVSQIEDKDLLKKKKEDFEEDLEELDEEIKKLQSEKSSMESKLKAVKASLERKKREEKERKNSLEKFRKVFDREYTDDQENADRYPEDGSKGWVKPGHIPKIWVEELDMSKEELWDRCVEKMD